jgi:hypothetical protein
MKYTVLYLLSICITMHIRSQCVGTSFTNATIFTTDNSTGVYDFSIPGNAQVSDNNRASAASLISILSGTTYYLKATGLNFSIPSYSSICGVTVEIEERATGLILTASVKDQEVRLIKNGVITGNNYAKGADWTSSDTYHSYGSSSDTWGLSLTPADVNASNFGVAISVKLTALVAALPSADIDHIHVKVTYNPILPVSLVSFNTGIIDNHVKIEWKTAGSEPHTIFNLQRKNSLDNDWRDIKIITENNITSDKTYTFEDMNLGEGQYSYRLKIETGAGMLSYSEIKQVSIGAVRNTIVYPNPTTDQIRVRSDKIPMRFVINNMTGRRWNVTPDITGTNSCIIDVSNLPPGVYMLNNGLENIRFVKR